MAKDIKIGDKEIRVRATPLTLLFYKQEFKRDFMGDMAKLEKIKEDIANLDTIVFLQMIWAMAKTDKYGESFPGFEDWLVSFDNIDFSDSKPFLAAMEEAAEGFFRGKQQVKQQRKNR